MDKQQIVKEIHDDAFYTQNLVQLTNLQPLHGWANSGEEAVRHQLHLRILGLRNFLHCTLRIAQGRALSHCIKIDVLTC
jgi:hypothetical protein